MKHFWLVKIHKTFEGIDDKTGEALIFENWRENIVDVFANSIEEAKQVLIVTGIAEGVHYNDIVEERVVE